MSSSPSVEQLLMQASAAGNTPEGVALAEAAVREADASENIQAGYNARNQLIRHAVFSGFYEKALVAFSWCLAKADERPEQFGGYQLLWNYKWIIEELIHFPRISREQITASLEDFRKRCLTTGYNERAAFFLGFISLMRMGDLATAEDYRSRWQKVKRDGMADCRACETNRLVEFHATVGDHERALQTAKPILDGRQHCAHVPHVTYARVLRSLWVSGEREGAQENHLKGYRLVRNNRTFIREQSLHLAHLLRSDQNEAAAALVRKHLPWALETKSLDYRFYFLVPSKICVERLRSAGLSSLRCRLPADVCPVARKASAPLKELSEWMGASITELATQFDARNGNRAFGKAAQEMSAELG